MSNPTGDALRAEGLKDTGGVIRLAEEIQDDGVSALHFTIAKFKRLAGWLTKSAGEKLNNAA